MKVNLKKSLVLFFGTVICVILISSFLGDKFISANKNESVDNIAISKEIFNKYPKLIEQIDAMPRLDLTYLKQLESDYAVDLNISYRTKKVFGVMVEYRTIKDYSVGIIFGFFFALMFLLKHLKNKNNIETQEERLGSNFLIYLNVYIISPIIIAFFHTLDVWLGWSRGGGVFIPVGLALGVLLALIVFVATVVFFARTAKSSTDNGAILWKIVEPIILLIILLLIYPVWFMFMG